MKSGERERVGALRLVSSELQKAHKDAAAGTQADEVAVLQRERKRRLEAAEAYRQAAREDLAEGEEAEAELIEAYLPAQLSDDELESLVAQAVQSTGASGMAQMGQVMKAAQPLVAGRAEGGRVAAAVKKALAG